MSSSIHLEVHFDATPHQVYEALMDADRHSTVCGGAKTHIVREAGGPFSCHDGQIVGVTIELEADTRIVQAWRVAGPWAPGVYSLVRYELEVDGTGTKLTLEHTGIPDGFSEHLSAGWEARYWGPMKAYFAR